MDFYYERARARHVLAAESGTAGMAQTLAYLRRAERDGGAGAQVTLLETPQLAWKRAVPVAQTLEALARRTYSQMWDIPDDGHQELMAETRRLCRADISQPERRGDAAVRASCCTKSGGREASRLQAAGLCYNILMALIPVVGRKTWKMRALIGALYLALSLGAVTMVYPFLVMLAPPSSRSTKSPVTTSFPATCAPTRPCSASMPRTNIGATWT